MTALLFLSLVFESLLLFDTIGSLFFPNKELLEANLETLYAILIPICNPVPKDQVVNSED